jgi:hypothetical protein
MKPGNTVVRQEIEEFDDGRQTKRCFDAEDRLMRIETYDESGALKAAIDYVYNADNVNVERIVRDAAGNELRRIELDVAGQELGTDSAGPVRWASMDGSEEGLAEKGQEKLGD